jgi:hypothetical protein
MVVKLTLSFQFSVPNCSTLNEKVLKHVLGQNAMQFPIDEHAPTPKICLTWS